MFNIPTFPFQNSTIKAIKFLRSFATEVIKERCLALQDGAETPKDVLEHILKEANINPDLDMEDLVDNFLTVFIAGIERLVLMSVLMLIFLLHINGMWLCIKNAIQQFTLNAIQFLSEIIMNRKPKIYQNIVYG